MSTSNVSVSYIAKKAKEATEEKDTDKQGTDQNRLAQICRNFIIERENEWRRDAEKYNMVKLCVLYHLLPPTSNDDENTRDADVVQNTRDADVVQNTRDPYIELRKILLRRMQQKVDNMRQSERWTKDSPNDHYFILNVKIGEV
jgi:hypothetical protein